MPHFYCQHCGQSIDAPDNMIGLDSLCPACQTSITIPNIENTPVPQKIIKQVSHEDHSSVKVVRNELYVKDGEHMPLKRCVKCGEASVGINEKNLTTNMILLLCPIFFLLLAKNRKIRFGLCADHEAIYKTRNKVSLGIFILAVACMALSFVAKPFAAISIFTFIAWIIQKCIPNPIRIVRIRKGFIHVIGSGSNYCNSIQNQQDT